MAATKKPASCTGCKALDGRNWQCDLGYPIVVRKVFTPGEPCPKPTTEEEYQDEKLDSKNQRAVPVTKSDMEPRRPSVSGRNKKGA